MSTSQTSFTHYGDDCDRFQKTALVAQFPLALQHLHVCWMDRGHANCGRCEKCLRTLIALELLGVRQHATSFPATPDLAGALQKLTLTSAAQLRFVSELIPHALEHHRPDFARALEDCVNRNRHQPRRRAPSTWTRTRNAVLTRLRFRPAAVP